MRTTTIRIDEEMKEILQELARQAGQPMSKVLRAAVEEYRRRRFLASANAAFAALKADPRSWQAEQEERRAWDATLSDGQKEER